MDDQNKTFFREKPEIELRDYFAGQAMNGLITKELSRSDSYDPQDSPSKTLIEALSGASYEIADAMLAARGEVVQPKPVERPKMYDQSDVSDYIASLEEANGTYASGFSALQSENAELRERLERLAVAADYWEERYTATKNEAYDWKIAFQKLSAEQ
jgi:hypothetical protein